MIILEEVNLSHPQVPRCDMLLPWADLNERHTITTQCSKGGEHKWYRLAVEYMWAITVRAFQD